MILQSIIHIKVLEVLESFVDVEAVVLTRLICTDVIRADVIHDQRSKVGVGCLPLRLALSDGLLRALRMCGIKHPIAPLHRVPLALACRLSW